jgi:uptake hydrogenase large subunit
MKTIDLSPIARIEGHLDFEVDVDGGKVEDARAIGALYRGFETILKGKDPMDALVITPRICGVCPTAHNTASAKALDDAFEAEVPANGNLVRSILLGVENTMSHATHTYALFGPDLANKKYKGHPAYPELARRFSALTGTSYKKAVLTRLKLDEVFTVFGGKHPHTTFVPGGVPVRPEVSDITKAIGILMEVQDFVEETILGGTVERWLENGSVKDVLAWLDEDESHANSDLGLIIKYGPEMGLTKIGKGPGNFLAYGVYEQADGRPWLPGGFFDGEHHKLDTEKITEHIKHSWYMGYEGGKHPFDGETSPHYEKGEKYSWAKCPRYDGKPAEVGPLARMVMDKDPLVMDLAKEFGANVFTRVLARIHEAARTFVQIRKWLDEIDPGQPSYRKPGVFTLNTSFKDVYKGPGNRPENAMGTGLTEAARGALGHWIKIEKGKIANYQVVTPTAWNVSPKDSNGVHGPIEGSVIGTPVPDEENPVEVQHVIRSYDPCLACTVHVIKGDRSYRYKVV